MFALVFLAITSADYELWACGSITKGWTPGQNQNASGLHRRDAQGAWTHPGYDHPYINAIAADPRDPATLYLASGNGMIRARSNGTQWRIMTGWDMTEGNGVAADSKGNVYLALPDGIGFSPDRGNTWTRRETGLRRKYTQAIRVAKDETYLVAATESGVFRSTDQGLHWTQAGAPGEMTFDVVQSPHNPKHWVAVAQSGNAYQSLDAAVTWTTIAAVPKVHTLYNAAFDPQKPNRIVLGGWQTGVLLTEDGGTTWKSILPNAQVWRVTVHPATGAIYAYVHEKELLHSTDNGKSWTSAGLPGGVIRDLVFLQQVAQ
ncbi:hypothetical protein F183_A47330 [Bryobacterales bacterium F-183]|nr:hypothetical protein F183_A47330 [Bryobacterales bacterium F-183]